MSTQEENGAPRTTRTTNTRFAKKSTQTPSAIVAEAPKPGTKRQAAIADKNKLKMMENFNPDLSNREKKKLEKKLKVSIKQGFINDAHGHHIQTGIDLCDCLSLCCTGCFFPCRRCGSTKCGPECRVNRKTKYESLEFHGFNCVVSNPLDALPS